MEGFTIGTLIIILVSIVVCVTIIMVPVQIRYLKGIKEEIEQKNISQEKYFDQMPVQEEILHANSQIHPFFIPANIIAWLWLKIKKEV
ncbi:DUF3949 domain-containing protein [Halobacillus sp. A5]|uniref:DUF3949 domain-containing protein n=1 Tax=Halobacillus sp. A5 TaxID=2880263 RepID=UPI0020A6B1E9|nr:DUF3949 domain-containing protein [Halobacillus sp. A5]MCP3028212.1 DUF3949 domain-containing protein [Halobacillus sp. A5]